MKIIGGSRGVRSFIALVLNFVTLYIAIILIAHGLNPMAVTLLACVVISSITIFYINKVNEKTKAAFASTFITLVILIAFIYKIGAAARIQGFGEEEYDEISVFSLYVGLDFTKIVICTIIMGLIGAITDVAVSISSSMHEIYVHNPDLTRRKLFESGMNVGKDILGTTTNTLYFAFIGGFMALLLWFKDLSYSLGDIINSKVFGAEMIQIICSGLGATIIIPITAFLTAVTLFNFSSKEKDMKEEVIKKDGNN
jgi:uncharacterized membrane protein